jgi:hypothetical protein
MFLCGSLEHRKSLSFAFCTNVVQNVAMRFFSVNIHLSRPAFVSTRIISTCLLAFIWFPTVVIYLRLTFLPQVKGQFACIRIRFVQVNISDYLCVQRGCCCRRLKVVGWKRLSEMKVHERCLLQWPVVHCQSEICITPPSTATILLVTWCTPITCTSHYQVGNVAFVKGVSINQVVYWSLLSTVNLL